MPHSIVSYHEQPWCMYGRIKTPPKGEKVQKTRIRETGFNHVIIQFTTLLVSAFQVPILAHEIADLLWKCNSVLQEKYFEMRNCLAGDLSDHPLHGGIPIIGF